MQFKGGACCIQGRREIQELNDFADRSLRPENQSEMIVRYEDSEGNKRIKGGSDLKASQAYPKKLIPTQIVWKFRHSVSMFSF